MNQLRWLFGCAIFLASFLLFLVEPIAAKQLLPTFGGSAAVWITCLVFFQTALLLAYLYAHWLATRPRWVAHLVLLALAAFSASLWRGHAVVPATTAHPVLGIFAALAISVGLPFLMLGATSPLLQVWFAQAQSGVRKIPYQLYALSNLASLLALASYPTLIEPNFALRMQWMLWGIGFVIFAIISAFLTFKTRAQTKTPVTNQEPAEPLPEPLPDAAPQQAQLFPKLLWFLLPMCAAMQLSAITSHLTANVAAIPLLWVLPLAAYLLSLIVAFQFPGLVPRWLMTRLLVVMLASLGYMLSQVDGTLPLKVSLFFYLLELFVACLFCHSEAYALRPAASSQSTLFYLTFAAGGAAGSFLIGIAFPIIFSFNYDLAISFFVTALLASTVFWSAGWGSRVLWVTASLLLLMLVFFLRIVYHRDTPVAVRNFYGSLRVKQSIGYPPGMLKTLTNGTIQHGTQIFSAEMLKTPTTYYAEDSGVGLALRFCCNGRPRNIGVIGLGVGTIAAYGKPGDQIHFYEINPAVVPIARQVFRYMRDSQAQVTITEGDARTSLANEPSQMFDVLVIDAFSGDAIPLHLLTTQAVKIYKRHLAPGGILAFHISNQHVDLEPEVALLAQAAGMQARRVASPINEAKGEFSATWVLVTSNEAFFEQPDVSIDARPAMLNPRVRLWTDDYSSLLPVLRW